MNQDHGVVNDIVQYGYHTKEIDKGILGEFSKIEEEFEELKDAYLQHDNIMVLCECSDLIGAIRHYVENLTNHSISLCDLIEFNNKTERAFKSGKR